MITDEQIEKILYKYTRRQDEFNLSVITLIAERLSKLAGFDDLYTLNNSSVMIEDIAEMEDYHKKFIKDQKKQLEDDFWWIAFVLYAEVIGFYETQIALQENTELYNAILNSIDEAKVSLEELLKNPVFVMRDLKNPAVSKSYSFKETYHSVMNEAFTYRNVSNTLRDIALFRTESQLFDSGVRYLINNSSNKKQSVVSANNAIRFNVLDSVKNLINKMQNIMGKQFGADGYELSAHVYPAPDHAPAQGHQFTKEEVDKMQSGEDFKDIDGNSYVGFVRNIGEWNCRHYFMQTKLGKKRTYTQEQLDKILEDNERGYTDENGKHRTLYECTQVQRRYEREIRNSKQKYLYAKALNNKNMMANARNRVGKLTTQYKQFSRKCDIPAKLERITVKDYK